MCWVITLERDTNARVREEMLGDVGTILWETIGINMVARMEIQGWQQVPKAAATQGGGKYQKLAHMQYLTELHQSS